MFNLISLVSAPENYETCSVIVIAVYHM